MTTSRILERKTALVTGGAGAIASASAGALLRDGAAVVLMGRRREALDDACQRLLAEYPEARVECVAGDAGKAEDVQAAMQQAWALHKRLDIVVATVGGGGFRPLLMHDTTSFMAELELNIASAFLAIRHGAPLLAQQGGGSIVCISSTAAQLSFRWLSSYCTGKAGLEALVRVAAEELATARVRVNAVRPGLTRSEATGPMLGDPTIMDAFIEQVPLGRVGEPQDIASAVRYLAGPESGWVTGQSFAVDGGNELRRNPALDDAIAYMYGKSALQSVLAGQIPSDEQNRV
ncbi:sugar dehydrogenase [Pandoraea terrae]|uniref:Sugar dehydrogenase n=1 Tax=Pandoraea terrae TaxID=1537710 RepID=A0A5E4S3E1_9BURK|nr:SDR family oxidoreductase [Pandoraea terrae]VVD70120.1 sugar dehydrogenase [Pandoraea terrae]